MGPRSGFIPLDEFDGPPIVETDRERRERREFMREYRQLARRAAKAVVARTRIARVARARATRRVGAAKPVASSSDDSSDGEPPRERVAVATVRPDGSPCTVVVEVDPWHIDPVVLIFTARRAAGHSLDSATRGLDDLCVDVVHQYAGGVA